MIILAFTNFPKPAVVLKKGSQCLMEVCASDTSPDIALPALIDTALRCETPSKFVYPEDRGSFTSVRTLKAFADGLSLAGCMCQPLPCNTLFSSSMVLWAVHSSRGTYCPRSNTWLTPAEVKEHQERGYTLIEIDKTGKSDPLVLAFMHQMCDMGLRGGLSVCTNRQTVKSTNSYRL